ncbi:MAG: SnoaL-like domain-containing protein [Acidimicrobiales bacterium]|nr:SnoaL-like domain-containing protein [Acidimicrobiales bacterium]
MTESQTDAYVTLRRLQNRYADIVTRRAWAELHDIMRPDISVVVNTLANRYEFTGPAEIGDFIGTQLEQFSFFEFGVLNTVMEIDLDVGVAGARMYMQELRQNVSDGRRTNAFGVYHDRFERDAEGRWWFATRQYQSYSRTAEAGADVDNEVFELPVIGLRDL